MDVPKLTREADDIWRLEIPQYFYEPNNVYLLTGVEPALIDAGHSCEEAVRTLQAGLVNLGYSPRDIAKVIYTHPHVDHMGGGAILGRDYGLPGAADGQLVGLVEDYGSFISKWRFLPRQLAAEYPDLRPELARPEIDAFYAQYFPLEGGVQIAEPLQEGDYVMAGSRRLRVLSTPGHSPYHICLWDEDGGTLFAGDLVLSNGPALASPTGDDIGMFLASLQRLQELPIRRIFPGHGPVLTDAGQSIKRSREMIVRHRQKVLDILETGPKKLSEVALDFFGRPEKTGTVGLASTVALTYLEWLEKEGVIGRQRTKGGLTFYLRDERGA